MVTPFWVSRPNCHEKADTFLSDIRSDATCSRYANRGRDDGRNRYGVEGMNDPAFWSSLISTIYHPDSIGLLMIAWNIGLKVSDCHDRIIRYHTNPIMHYLLAWPSSQTPSSVFLPFTFVELSVTNEAASLRPNTCNSQFLIALTLARCRTERLGDVSTTLCQSRTSSSPLHQVRLGSPKGFFAFCC